MTNQFDASSQVVAGVKEGQIIAGKYRIERILGAGGMGVVVAAYHIHLDERVAIKFLLPDALAKAEVVARFAREARAAVKIKSEHVARVIDVGTLETGAPYMVMEYLDGSDLGAWVQQRGALPIEQAVEFVLQAGEAIADAHVLGIIHRDLKPANLFCVRRSDGLLAIKVLDFGISKLTSLGDSGTDMRMTKTSSVLGSPLYMSPEQMLSSRDVDARTDIWALGVILYELLVGKVPFNGETLAELCVKVATMPAPPLRDQLPGAPLALQEVIQKCLEKDRANRYSSIAELAVALCPFAPKRAHTSVERIARVIQAAGLVAGTQDLLPNSEAFHVGSSQTQAAWGQTKAPTLWKRAGLPATVTLLLVGSLGLAAWLFTSRRGPLGQDPGANLAAETNAGVSALPGSSSAPLAASTSMANATATGKLSVAASTAIPSHITPKNSHAQPSVGTRPTVLALSSARALQDPKFVPAVAPQRTAQPALDACVPSCRAAEVCVRGQCVSACNPPCPVNEVCTPHRTCVSACNPLCAANEKCIAGQCLPR